MITKNNRIIVLWDNYLIMIEVSKLFILSIDYLFPNLNQAYDKHQKIYRSQSFYYCLSKLCVVMIDIVIIK